MGLLIALGAPSKSSERLAAPNPYPDTADDGVALEPVELYQTVAHAVCPQKEWSVRVSLSYYDLLRPDGKRETTMAEARIQVAPFLGRNHLSSRYHRETVHHLKLPDGAQDDYPQSEPVVLISDDRRHLACLLFHPHQQSSALVIFQLRKPRSDYKHNNSNNYEASSSSSTGGGHSNNNHNIPPLPTYIHTHSTEASSSSSSSSSSPLECPAVATNPRLASVWGITAICNLPNNVFPPLLLGGCQDGNLVWIDYRSSLAVATGSLGSSSGGGSGGGGPPKELHVECTSLERGSILAIYPNGHASLVRWSMEQPIQQLLFKRASTGAIAVEQAPTFPFSTGSSSISTSTSTTSPHKPATKERHAPSRTTSDSIMSPQAAKRTLGRLLASKLGPNRMTRRGVGMGVGMDKTVVQPKDKTVLQNEMKRHMDQFVLKELQKKTTTGMGHTNNTRSPMMPQQHHNTHRRRRRRSDVSGGLKKDDDTQRQMLISPMTQLYRIQTAIFCSSTVIVVLYQPGSVSTLRGTPRAAQAFGIEEDGTLVDLAQLELSHDRLEDLANHQQEIPSSSNINKCGLDYDALTGSVAVSTVYNTHEDKQQLRYLACVWNWRANVVGWMWTASNEDVYWSRFFFAQDHSRGPSLVLVEAREMDDTQGSSSKISISKQVVTAGVLSPPCSRTPEVTEQCSMLLSGVSVTFPVCSQPTAKDSVVLEWKESLLPTSYTSAHGPPQIAAIGRQHGRSLAMASSSGLCMLDIGNVNRVHKWRLFGSETEERAFKVLTMTWWEGAVQGPEHESDDLLVAIVQSNSGQQYLSCWSPKRLDLARQLVEPIEPHQRENSSATDLSWGIPLPKDFPANSLSLLSEPEPFSQRRAVAFVWSTNDDTCEIEYVAFQLQIARRETNDAAESYVEHKPYSVIAHVPSNGTIKNGPRLVGPISAVFLASASFRFDLVAKRGKPKIKKRAALTTSNEKDSSGKEAIVTLGVIRTPGGLEAMSLASGEGVTFAPVVDMADTSKYWLSDVICQSRLGAKDGVSSGEMDAFVWAIELVNGELFCWSVPFLCEHRSEEKEIPRNWSPLLSEAKKAKPKGLAPPSLVCKRNSRNTQAGLMLGVVCHIGNASDWIEQSTSLNQSDLSMGQVPASNFGCVLSAGQTSKKLHRSIPGDFDTDAFASDFLDYEVFSPGDFIMAPPAFVPSLYSLFLEAAYIRSELPAMEASKVDDSSELLDEGNKRLSAIEKHIQYRLHSSPNEDAVLMALRLLTIRSVDILSNVHRKLTKQQTDESHIAFLLAGSLFSEVVNAVRQCTTNLQFASLFLEVGRQIEPSCLPYLFPLPTKDKRESKEESKVEARTVMDLFTLSVNEGSLAASTSALPLLGSKHRARQFCEQLIKGSLEQFAKNVASADLVRFDSTEEERRILGDMFRFGIKLEDATGLEEMLAMTPSEDSNQGQDTDWSQPSSECSEDHTDHSSVPSSPNQSSRQLMCMSRRNSSILHYIMPSVFSSSNLLEEEEAIKLAATSFIKHELEDSKSQKRHIDSVIISSVANANKEDSYPIQLEGIGAVVGKAFVDLLHSSRTRFPWKSLLSLARLLLPDNHKSIPWGTRFKALLEEVQPEDLDTLIPTDFEGSEGMDRIVCFIVVHIGSCGHEIDGTEASLIVDLILLLLQRLDELPLLDDEDAAITCAGLVVAGLVSGNIADRIPDLLSQVDRDCVVRRVYEQVTSELASSL